MKEKKTFEAFLKVEKSRTKRAVKKTLPPCDPEEMNRLAENDPAYMALQDEDYARSLYEAYCREYDEEMKKEEVRQEIAEFGDSLKTEHRSFLLNEARQIVTAYYSSERVHYFTPADYKDYWTPHALKPDTLKTFLNEHKDGIPEREVWDYGKKTGLPQLLYDALILKDEKGSYLHGADSDCFRNTVFQPLVHLSYELASDLSEEFTPEVILEYLKNNPNYRRMFDDVEKIRHGILTEIPERYCDLYPNARIRKRHFILHIGPVNSGKTYDALQAFYAAEHAVYLAPLRLLAAEISDETASRNIPCSFITGEERREVPGASHISETIEMLDTEMHYNLAVIDEAQMLSDRDRGGSWTRAVLGVNADEVHVCGAPYVKDLLIRLIEECKDTWELKETERLVPLVLDESEFRFPDDVLKGDALIVFSRRDIISVAAELQGKGIRSSLVYGSLPYEARRREVQRFSNGETDVLTATDAIGMGMNLPIHRIVFLQNEKYDGVSRRPLKPHEVQQIAGRAGRAGMYNIGFYTSSSRKKFFTHAMSAKIHSPSKALIDFPETLVQIDGSLSSIMSQWISIPVQDGYQKTDLTEKLILCNELEKKIRQKDVLWKLLTIPWNRNDDQLRSLFYRTADLCAEGKILIPEKRPLPETLEALESYCRVCDFLYAYLWKFAEGNGTGAILQEKKEAAEKIMEILIRENHPYRTCMYCGRRLRWDSKYSMCERCYNRRNFWYY